MSTFQDTLTKFKIAKETFLEKARNATVTDGVVDGIEEMDSELYDLVELGMEAGQDTDSPELTDLVDIARLFKKGSFTLQEWNSVLEDLTQSNGASPPFLSTMEHTAPSQAEPTHPPTSPLTPGTQDLIRVADPVPAESTELPSLPSPSTTQAPIPRERTPIPSTQSSFLSNAEPSVLSGEPSEPRPRTSSKSLELLHSTGILKRKRVMLLLGKPLEQKAEEGSDEEDEDEEKSNVKAGGRRQRKRRRILSSTVVPSSGEEADLPKPTTWKSGRTVNEGWQTVSASRPCLNCINAGKKCETFVLRSRGQPRFACCRCHDLKKMCDQASSRRNRYVSQRERRQRGLPSDEDEDEDEDGEATMGDAGGRSERMPARTPSRTPSRKPSRKPPAGRTAISKANRSSMKVKFEVDEWSAGADDEDDGNEDDGEQDDRNEDEGGEDDAKEVQRMRGKPSKGKGKAKENGKGKGKEKEKGKDKGKRREKSVSATTKGPKEEVLDDDNSLWMDVGENESGPSRGRIRRPRESAGDIANLYAQMREMERVATDLSEKTVVEMQEVRGQLDRLGASQDTQIKYLVKEIGRVEGIAESAKDVATGVQDQVSSVRQQTTDMHNSLTAMQRHSEQLTKGLQDMMLGFREMKFDMPTKFDNWLKIRLGHEGGHPSTISGEDLQREWNAHHPPIPAPPPIPPLDAARIPGEHAAGPHSESDREGATRSSRPSSTELYTTYLNPQSSQDNLLSQDNGVVMDFASNKDTAMDTDGPGDSGDGRDSGGENPTEAREVVMGSTFPGEAEDGEIVDDGPPSISNDTGEPLPEPVDSIPSAAPSNASMGGPIATRASAHQEMAAIEPFSAASPISPDIVRSTSVEPPVGLLARNVPMSPSSSQTTIPSPSPLPPRQLLEVNAHREMRGPITRSRSRSRSRSPSGRDVTSSRKPSC